MLIIELTESDYASAARTLGCDVPAIQAFASVESSGSGFLPDGRPKILFEAHAFHERNSGRFDGHQDRYGVSLSSPTWNPHLYGSSGTHQWERHDDAAALNAQAADESCSWGMFQIMGENWHMVGYASLEAFVQGMKSGAGAHLEAFVSFIASARLVEALRAHEWEVLARGYNGPGQVFGYGSRLQAAYSRLIMPKAA